MNFLLKICKQIWIIFVLQSLLGSLFLALRTTLALMRSCVRSQEMCVRTMTMEGAYQVKITLQSRMPNVDSNSCMTLVLIFTVTAHAALCATHIGSTINTYIHLSILCYSLNSSQFELTNVNFCHKMAYHTLPSRHAYVTWPLGRHLPSLCSLPNERVCIVNILSLISRFSSFLEALPRSRRILFSKALQSYFRLNVFHCRRFAYGGRRNLRFCFRYFFVSKFWVFCRRTLPPRSLIFSAPVFPRQVRPSHCSFYARSLATYSF